MKLIELTARSINTGLPLFNNLLDEPVFYRRFRSWVEEGMAERRAMEKIDEDAMKMTRG